jgi:hypothetical protein
MKFEKGIISFDDDDIKQTHEYWREERIKQVTPIPMLNMTAIDNLKDPPAEADITQFPFCTGGILCIQTAAGIATYGSAQFCGDLYIILTAAHCIIDPISRVLNTKFLFFGGYKQGMRTQFAIRKTLIPQKWLDKTIPLSDLAALDYAFLITKQPSSGNFMHYKLNIPYTDWTAIGYPKNISDGKIMQQVTGSNLAPNPGVGIVGMQGNSMGAGCSGGAWIGDLAVGDKPDSDTNYIIGLNSNVSPQDPSIEYGPLFDADFDTLFGKPSP